MSDDRNPCRTAFANTILEEARKDKHIFVVTTDSRGSVTLENFAAELPGQSRTLLEGSDVTIISCGGIVFHALEAGKQLKSEGINTKVIDMYSIKPIDSETIISAAMETGHILTVEEHSICGGLGSIFAEIVIRHCPVKMKILGFPDENVINAKPLEVFDYYGLTAKKLISSAKALLTYNLFQFTVSR